MKTHKTYDLVSNFMVECSEEDQKAIIEELTYALIDIVEKRKAYCGGGFSLLLAQEPE